MTIYFYSITPNQLRQYPNRFQLVWNELDYSQTIFSFSGRLLNAGVFTDGTFSANFHCNVVCLSNCQYVACRFISHAASKEETDTANPWLTPTHSPARFVRATRRLKMIDDLKKKRGRVVYLLLTQKTTENAKPFEKSWLNHTFWVSESELKWIFAIPVGRGFRVRSPADTTNMHIFTHPR